MNPEQVASHLRKLRGDVLEGEVFFIDGQPLKALRDFNIYTEQNRLVEATNILHQTIKHVEAYVEWLIADGAVEASVGLEKGPEVSVYRTFPFCPSYRAVLKTVVIISSCVSEEDLLKITPYGIYVYTLLRDQIKLHEDLYDGTKSYFQNYEVLVKVLDGELRQREDQWMMDILGQISDLNRGERETLH